MLVRPFLYDATSCASYVVGCTGEGELAVVDRRESLDDEYRRALAVDEPGRFAQALLANMSPAPPGQEHIVAANRAAFAGV